MEYELIQSERMESGNIRFWEENSDKKVIFTYGWGLRVWSEFEFWEHEMNISCPERVGSVE